MSTLSSKRSTPSAISGPAIAAASGTIQRLPRTRWRRAKRAAHERRGTAEGAIVARPSHARPATASPAWDEASRPPRA